MSITRSVQVQASPDRVWELVSDLPGMGRLSPENTGGRWLGRATGPAVGARFRGSNRNGWRRWSTTVEVTRCTPGSAFAFAVTSYGLPVSHWSYELVPHSEGGCTVTESWEDRRPGWFKGPAGAVTGVRDREAATVASIDATLAALKEVAESAP
ncbi:MAG: SRPBCC family protein [Mycobacteriales bacterium]